MDRLCNQRVKQYLYIHSIAHFHKWCFKKSISRDPSPRYHLFRLKWNPIPNLKGKPTVNNKDLIYLNIKGSSRKRPIHFQIRNDFLYSRMRFWESLPLAENINGIE